MDKIAQLQAALDDFRRTMIAAREYLGEGLQLTRTQLEIIMMLTQGPKATSELARHLLLTQGAVTQTVDTLVRRQLVTRGPDPEDRRVIRLALSPDGEAISTRVHNLRQHFIEQLSRQLTPEEINALISATEKMSTMFASAHTTNSTTNRD